MALEYLPIDARNIVRRPDNFILSIDGEKYRFLVRFSPLGTRGYISIYDSKEKAIVQGAALEYGADVLRNMGMPFGLVPLAKNSSAEKENVTAQNIQKSIRVYIV